MGETQTHTINEAALKPAITEIKLHINQKLYQKGAITEEMYTRAKELILKCDNGRGTYGYLQNEKRTKQRQVNI